MIMRLLTWFTNAFPVWVLLGGVIALAHPAWFVWFTPYIVPGLAVIMLGMGMTLSVDDFRSVAKMPRAIGVGFAAHYMVMPFLGWSITKIVPLPDPIAAGVILVSCCPCGTASNVVNYLAHSNVALSVLLTMCSTFGAVFLTPLLTKWLAGALVPVDGWGLFFDTIKVVLLPVLGGLALHHLFPRLVKAVSPVSPLVSVMTIALICASIIGKNADAVRQSGGAMLLAVFLLHASGFALGYLFSRAFGYDTIINRTISIEVGMQNSGLAVVLAQKNFSPLTAVPCAVSSVFHSVIGSVLAGIWRLRPPLRHLPESARLNTSL